MTWDRQKLVRAHGKVFTVEVVGMLLLLEQVLLLVCGRTKNVVDSNGFVVWDGLFA